MTGNKQADLDELRAQLHRSEAERKLLRQILDTLPDNIYIKDSQSRFLFANQALCRQMGVEHPDELRGKTDFDFYPEELAKSYHQDEVRIMTGEEKAVHKEEASFNVKTQEQGWLETSKIPYLDEDGDIGGIIGIGRHITARKNTEAALKESEARFRWLIDSIPQYIFGKDLEGRFIIVNRQYSQGEKKSPAEIIGKTDFDIHPPDLAAKYRADDLAVMKSGKTQSILEEHPDPETGERHYVQVIKAPLFDHKGEVAGMLGVFWDVTEEHKITEQNIRLQLEQERVQLLTSFITKATHEFNTSLSILETCLYFLENQINPSKTPVYIERMQTSSRHIHKLVEGLVTLTRLDSSETLVKNPVDLMSLWHNVLASVQVAAEDKFITIEVQAPPSLPQINANPYDLITAFKCLLDNALRYTRPQGQIKLEIQSHPSGLQMILSDTGIGISPEEQERVFDRFYRADQAHTTRGLGLGLPIAKRIIELHGGGISLESELERGSRFTIFLPY